uniref:Putative conserved secreted protein n=1 Tax=Ixodes ricinus TaxID=34613 RepID=A0A6B0UNJ5_IXORI
MQLVLFIVIVTFTPLSCEEISESGPDIYEEFKYLPPVCQEKLKEQMAQRCSEHPFQPLLVEVSQCKFKCGNELNNGRTKLTSGQSFDLKDGTPCGQNKICIDGQCIPRCSMPFVKLLKGIK